MVKIIPDMWRKWVEASKEDLAKSFELEKATEQFTIEKYIKNKADAADCLSLLGERHGTITVYQKELLVRSAQYPQVDWSSIRESVDWAQSREDFPPPKLRRAQLELCFIGATRTDDSKGLRSAMRRSELLDFIMRLAQQFAY